MNELLTNLLSALGLAWWVEIITDSPCCLYYFGIGVSASVRGGNRATGVREPSGERNCGGVLAAGGVVVIRRERKFGCLAYSSNNGSDNF